MVLKNNMKKIASHLLVALLAVGLAGCGGDNNSVIGGGSNTGKPSEPGTSNPGKPSEPGTSNPGTSNSVKPSEPGTSQTPSNSSEQAPTIDKDSILDQFDFDLEVDDGEPVFEEEIVIKVWSINGDPDKAVQQKLFAAFNEQYLGAIRIEYNHIGHFDFYSSLDTTWMTDRESIPDILFMHNEKTIQYAAKEYMWPLDPFFGDDVTGVEFDFSQTYKNIDRVTKWNGNRYAIPVDAHGFLTSIRQDIIKKNELGFDNNTRFIPESRAEYQSLLEGLRAKADAGDLWIRDLNKGSDHSWKKANAGSFYPEFMQSTDPDGLSALYANGGTLASEDQTKVTYHENKGFQTYLTDQVDRYNNRLMGDGTNTAMFGLGNTVMFSEGPWYLSMQYDKMWNNAELTRAGQLGVTAEDAADPIYSRPYIASHPQNWWTLEENMSEENDGKWYGNGHAISVTRNVTSLAKMAACLEFARWYTQGADYNDDSKNNLTTWCASGHIPAWKNIYESEHYQAELADNMTLRALGDPADIMAMEGLRYETNFFDGLGTACSTAQTAMKNGGATHESVLKILRDGAESLQTMIDFLITQS